MSRRDHERRHTDTLDGHRHGEHARTGGRGGDLVPEGRDHVAGRVEQGHVTGQESREHLEQLVGSATAGQLLGQRVRDRVTTTQSLHRFVDQQAVDRLGYLDERNDTTQFDDRQTRLRRLLDQRRRDLRQLRPDLDGHSGDTAGRQFTHVPPQSGRVGRRECEPAGQQQLAAAKEVRDVDDFTRMHPAHGLGQQVGSGPNDRASGSEARVCEDIG